MNRAPSIIMALLAAVPALAQGPPAPRPRSPHPLPPGIYEIRPTHSSLCVTFHPAAGLRVPYLNQMPCEANAPRSRVVFLGPSSIDVLPCNTLPGEPCSANPADQVFRLAFIRRGPRAGTDATGDVYEVRTANNECWDIQDAKNDQGVDVIRWACNGQGNQRFRFTFVAPFDPSSSLTCARRAGW